MFQDVKAQIQDVTILAKKACFNIDVIIQVRNVPELEHQRFKTCLFPTDHHKCTQECLDQLYLGN